MFALAAILISEVARCNLHFCFFAALGAVTVLRAVLAARDRHFNEAREHGVSGLIHLIIAMLAL